ncbi:hypothetical protein [Methylobacterium symbioticum]|uniref:Uncharacterized protein n=1 Tax=Methylobacterium symbioticum TaxID=2584084 RepID=A0A509EAS9_9HYPH|nr:hypothetical protein [Methylobacterium symbioticum]VUD70655.1 hypothetical protein MET9862_01227 [Methylobacterium symbioticum]
MVEKVEATLRVLGDFALSLMPFLVVTVLERLRRNRKLSRWWAKRREGVE